MVRLPLNCRRMYVGADASIGPQHRGGHNGILTVKPQQNCQIITKHNQPAVQQH